MKKRISLLLALAMAAAILSGCSKTSAETTAAETTAADTASAETTAADTASAKSEAEAVTLKVGSLKGPTSMGLVELMDQSSKGTAKGSYEFTMVTAADELLGKIVSGDLDIALVPANMASIIYNKTSHGVQVLNINTLGVLYAVSADDSIGSIAGLKGRTVYLTGKGTSPDYVLQYLLKAAGLTTDDVTLEYKSEAAEVAAILKQQPDAIGILPQPFVTAAMAQNDQLKMVLDLTNEWEAVSGDNGSSLVTGVTICRGDLFADNASAEAVRLFMEEHRTSAGFASTNVSEAAKLIADAGIIEKAPVAEKAIPYCNITCIEGEEMKKRLSGYLEALFEMDPGTVGGTLPAADFFYLP